MEANAWFAIRPPGFGSLSKFNVLRAAGILPAVFFQLHINHKLITNTSQKRLLCYKYHQRKEGFSNEKQKISYVGSF